MHIAMASNNHAHRDGWRRYQPHLPGRLPLTESELPREERWGWQGLEVHLDRYAAADAPLTVLGLHDGGGNERLMAPMGVVERRPARALSRSAATAAKHRKGDDPLVYWSLAWSTRLLASRWRQGHALGAMIDPFDRRPEEDVMQSTVFLDRAGPPARRRRSPAFTRAGRHATRAFATRRTHPRCRRSSRSCARLATTPMG